MRRIQNLTEGWYFFKDQLNITEGLSDLPDTAKVCLPHTWNAGDGQDGGNDYYRGECFYVRKIYARELLGECNFIEITGAANVCTVYFNGMELGTHSGGYSAFRFALPEKVQEENILMISVSNAENSAVYPQKADFTFYGGLYREVRLITVPKEHFELLHHGSEGIKVTPKVDAVARRAEILVETWQNADSVSVTIGEETKVVSTDKGYARVEFVIENVRLWDGLKDPYLYTATARLSSGDAVQARFGCREFYCDPEKGFFLNGRSYPLRGVSRHQDRKGKGNALAWEDHRQDMELIREIGANTIRLAHYQHSQEFYALCDEAGMIVWAEIPYITMHAGDAKQNSLDQMYELVVQNYHHPSIICWGLSNEITAASIVDEELLENHRLLHELCHSLDSTRKTVMANVFMLDMESPILEIPDMNSYNLYFGWYLGELEQNDAFFDEYHQKYPDRVIGFSEYGADANTDYHSQNPQKGDYTEEYQALYHEHMVRMIEKRPYLWATHVWNMFDFAADGRDEGGKHGENQKGLVSFDRSIKKDAFYLYKAAWNKHEGFVHLCGRRYVDRHEKVTKIKVYSNQKEIVLFVDGKELSRKAGKTVFEFEVPIGKEHRILAQAGEYSDSMRIRYVQKPNADYIFNTALSEVQNWFDAQEMKEGYFSVKDTLGELRAHAQASKVVEQMMAKASEARGEVAQVVKDNPALQRMMNQIPLISLMKQGGADEESIRTLNRILQEIRK